MILSLFRSYVRALGKVIMQMFGYQVLIISPLDRCLHYFPVVVPVNDRCAPTRCFHTGICKFLLNISMNIWSLGKCARPKLGEVSYIISLFHSFSTGWFFIYLLLRDSENNLLTRKILSPCWLLKVLKCKFFYYLFPLSLFFSTDLSVSQVTVPLHRRLKTCLHVGSAVVQPKGYYLVQSLPDKYGSPCIFQAPSSK